MHDSLAGLSRALQLVPSPVNHQESADVDPQTGPDVDRYRHRTKLTDAAQVELADTVRRADGDLATLTSQYGELAADVSLMGASMLPPPWGTAADLASLGKSLATGDWGGALFDVIGIFPVIGDGVKALGKGAKAVDRLNDLRKSIDAATTALARSKQVLAAGKLDEMAAILSRTGNWMQVRKSSAKRYWEY